MPLPRTVHLASIVLPPAGAFLAANATATAGGSAYVNGPAAIADQVTQLLFELVYVPASSSSAPKVYIESTSEGGAASRPLIVDSTLTIAGAVASRNAYFEELKLPLSPLGSGVPWTYYIPYRVERGMVGARLVVAEYGDESNPGTVTGFVGGGYGS